MGEGGNAQVKEARTTLWNEMGPGGINIVAPSTKSSDPILLLHVTVTDCTHGPSGKGTD